MSTYTCEFCGEQLIFRVIDGTTVPLHPRGSQCVGKSLYRTENLHRCCITDCPKCTRSVYFVRHNGGSVWLDDLGWPWPKHGCFDQPSHRLPTKWEELGTQYQGALCQAWLYGILRNESGGAFLVCNNPLPQKPYLKYKSLVRLMCSPEYLPRLEKLDGKLLIRTKADYVTLDGEFLIQDGTYKSSLGFW